MAHVRVEQMADTMATKVYRNWFASDGAHSNVEAFHKNTMDTIRKPMKSLYAPLTALQRFTGCYRFAIVNALTRHERTYITFDDIERAKNYAN